MTSASSSWYCSAERLLPSATSTLLRMAASGVRSSWAALAVILSFAEINGDAFQQVVEFIRH